jgi:hypothetical protein
MRYREQNKLSYRSPGRDEATIEDLAFPIRSLREPDKVGRRGCIEHVFYKGVGLDPNKEHHHRQRSKHAEFRSRRKER